MLKSILDVCSQFAVGSLWIHGVGIFVSMEGEYSSEILDFFFLQARFNVVRCISSLGRAPADPPPHSRGSLIHHSYTCKKNVEILYDVFCGFRIFAASNSSVDY